MTIRSCCDIYRVTVVVVCVVYILKEIVFILYYLSDYHKYIISYYSNYEARILYHPTFNLDQNISSNPVASLVFLKTHKTAGSTVSRLLFRELCELNAATKCFVPSPQHAGRIWDLENDNDRSFIMKNSPYDVWLHHLKISRYFLTEVVPNAQAVVSIVRRPAHRFISAWNWYNHSATLHMSLNSFTIHQILSSSPGQCRFPSFLNSFLVNHIFGLKFRTGLDSTREELTVSSGLLPELKAWWKQYSQYKKSGQLIYSSSGSNRIELKTTTTTQFRVSDFEGLLKEIAEGRLFVIVSERINESLVLLADYLNWDISRMLYHSHKVATRGSSAVYETLDVNLMAELDKCQPYDTALYLVASRVLDSRIQLYNNRYHDKTAFNRKLTQFVILQKKVHRLCSGVSDKSSYRRINNSSVAEFAKFYCSSLIADNREGLLRYHNQSRMSRIKRVDTNAVLQHVHVD